MNYKFQFVGMGCKGKRFLANFLKVERVYGNIWNRKLKLRLPDERYPVSVFKYCCKLK